MKAATCIVFLLFLPLFFCDVLPSTCGMRKHVGLSRILSGTKAVKGEWPWQVSMMEYGSHVCGGLIISDRWILTAAHCVVDVTSTSYVTIGVGMSRRGDGKTMRVAKIFDHAKYDDYQMYNDIALIKLSGRLTFDDYIQPICVPKSGKDFTYGDSVDCWATGWGSTRISNYGNTPKDLMQVKLRIAHDSVCEDIYGDFYGKYWICQTGDPKGGICAGDSGGAMACKSSSKPFLGPWYIAGVHSFGTQRNCAHGYAGSTRVGTYYQWIVDKIRL